MKTYCNSITPNGFILRDDGVYVGTIPATLHGLGTAPYVVKAVKRTAGLEMQNVICSYDVEPNGDVKIYADEPVLYRYTLAAD